MDRRGRVYRLLLKAFPGDFVRAHGREMESLFRAMCRDREEREGRLGAGFWVALVADTARQAMGEWASRSTARRHAHTGEAMSTFLHDVRYALRQIRRQPGYALTVVVLMAVGVAGNAAVFRVVNGLFLRPLPFPEADRLVDIDETAPSWNLEYTGIAYPNFDAWRRENTTFEAMAVYGFGGGALQAEGTARWVDWIDTSHGIDDVLRLTPLAGRFYSAAEDRPDAAPVAMLSSAFWRREWAGDPGVVGRTITVDGESVEIVGVLPEAAAFLGKADMWRPLRVDPDEFEGWSFSGIGRLADGVDIARAREELTRVHRALPFETSDVTTPVIASLRDRYLGEYRLGSGFLLGAVGVVLLIACANIAGLMTARAVTRGPELGVRVALGAPRGRIARQLLTEGLVLATVGGAVGTALGVWGSGALIAPMREQFPAWVTFALDARFVAFVVLVTAGAALAFGILPALRSARTAALAGGASRNTAGPGRRRAMHALVLGEVALAMALLVVGGLGFLDVRALDRTDAGIDRGALTTYAISLPSTRYEDDPARLEFAERYLSALEAEPEVASAALASSFPLQGHWGWFFQVDGAPAKASDAQDPVVLNRVVSPGYFDAVGVDILAGRGFDDLDGRDQGNPVVVVDEAFVRSHLSYRSDPLGARLASGSGTPAPDATWYTVIGVAEDVRHYGLDEAPRPGVYQPLTQNPLGGFLVALRPRGDIGAALDAARRVTRGLDSALPVWGIEAMADSYDQAMGSRRATAWLLAIFSGVALLLAVAGIWGVVAYTVGNRRRDISVRVAMGARQAQVVGQIVRGGMVPVAFGVLVGLLAAAAGAEVVSRMLVDMDARDPRVYAAVALLLVSVAGVAHWIPARKAARLDPAASLRAE